METMDRIIGIWMIIAGGALFVFAHMLKPYMDTLSGATLYAVAIPTAVLLGVPVGALIGYGVAQATGAISIRITGVTS